MSLLVVGWGSLIYKPEPLRLASRWHRTGPRLPVEFLRVSTDGRLTLVIDAQSELQTTLWAELDYHSLGEAQQALAKREGTGLKNIEAISLANREALPRALTDWAIPTGIEGVVWTSLRPRDAHQNSRGMSQDEAMGYLRLLQGERLSRAKDYVRKTPVQINTALRRRIRTELGWSDIELPTELFEP